MWNKLCFGFIFASQSQLGVCSSFSNCRHIAVTTLVVGGHATAVTTHNQKTLSPEILTMEIANLGLCSFGGASIKDGYDWTNESNFAVIHSQNILARKIGYTYNEYTSINIIPICCTTLIMRRETHLILFPVLNLTHCGIGLFVFIFLASFLLIWNDL